MLRRDAREAAEIVRRNVDALSGVVIGKGRVGASLRLACGDLKANAERLIRDANIGAAWMDCYDKSREAGATWQEMLAVQRSFSDEEPKSLAATIVRAYGSLLALITVSRIFLTVSFRSRQDVDAAKDAVNSAFNEAEELIADDMQADVYQALVALHGATIAFLVERERPLPRMLQFQFNSPKPSLWFAYRLYADASRADQLRAENRVVHPAFMRPRGRALSN